MMEGTKYFLEPGYIFVSNEPHLIHTVLGSCVSVCLWDVRSAAGGMNHFLLPRAEAQPRVPMYGDVSTRHLIHMLRERGIEPANLRAHIIGGGFNEELGSFVGEQNIAVAAEILERNGITVVTVDTGGATGRKVIFNNLSGEVIVYKNIAVRRTDWYGNGPAEN